MLEGLEGEGEGDLGMVGFSVPLDIVSNSVIVYSNSYVPVDSLWCPILHIQYMLSQIYFLFQMECCSSSL